MGKLKELLFRQHLHSEVDCFMDEQYHYEQWLKTRDLEDKLTSEEETKPLDDIECKTKEEPKKNNNLNKG